MNSVKLEDFSCKFVGTSGFTNGIGKSYTDELNQPKHSMLIFEMDEVISCNQFQSYGFFTISYKNSNILSITTTKNQFVKESEICKNMHLKVELTTLSGSVLFAFKDNKMDSGINKVILYINVQEFAKILAKN